MPSATSASRAATDAPLTIAILAGGAGTRMGGRDKGLEMLAGRPLVAHVVAAARAMAVRWAGEHAGGVALLVVANRNVALHARHAPTIGDAVAGFPGPLAGVAAALAARPLHAVLTLPVDCPDPPDELLARLHARLAASTAPAVAAHDGVRLQPLFALYRPGLGEAAARALQAGSGVHAWQQALGAAAVDFADRRQQFSNLNTPHEFHAHAERTG
jgi:molybdenum cofactor guanylyltransferase